MPTTAEEILGLRMAYKETTIWHVRETDGGNWSMKAWQGSGTLVGWNQPGSLSRPATHPWPFLIMEPLGMISSSRTADVLRIAAGQVRPECLTCTFRASCCGARVSWAQVPLSWTRKKGGRSKGEPFELVGSLYESTSSPTGIGSRRRVFDVLWNLECHVGLIQKRKIAANAGVIYTIVTHRSGAYWISLVRIGSYWFVLVCTSSY